MLNISSDKTSDMMPRSVPRSPCWTWHTGPATVCFSFLLSSTLRDHNSTCHATGRDSRGQRVFACTCSALNIFMHCLSCHSALCSGNDERSQRILGQNGLLEFTSLLTLSLSLSLPVSAQRVYFRKCTWVITVMEEHLRQQHGFSWGVELKGGLWVRAGAQRNHDSWNRASV